MKKYQSALRKVVKNYVGMTGENKIRQDVKNLFIDLSSYKFRNVGVSETEDLRGFFPLLMKRLPDGDSRGVFKRCSKAFTK